MQSRNKLARRPAPMKPFGGKSSTHSHAFLDHVLRVCLRMDGALVAQIAQRIHDLYLKDAELAEVNEAASSQRAPSQPGTSSSKPSPKSPPLQRPGANKDLTPHAKKPRCGD